CQRRGAQQRHRRVAQSELQGPDLRSELLVLRPAMKTKSILAILLLATVAVATERVRFAPASTSTIKITGTSTLHEWSMEGTTSNGAIDIAPEIAADPLQPEAWKSEKPPLVTVKIPVAAIKAEADRMKRIMLDAENADAGSWIDSSSAQWPGGKHPPGHRAAEHATAQRVVQRFALAMSRHDDERIDGNRRADRQDQPSHRSHRGWKHVGLDERA